MLMHDSHIPLFIQLAEILQEQIESGQIASGEKLESESEMMGRYGIGRLTVRSALSQLVNKSYVKKVHGKGTFCCYTPHAPARRGIDVLLNIEDTYFIPYYLKSISQVLNDQNCDMLVSDTRDSAIEICATLDRIVENGSSGIILQPSYDVENIPNELMESYKRVKEARIPFVMIDGAYPFPNASFLGLDDECGGRIAAEYLHGLGHTNVAILYYEGRQDSLLRRSGFTDAYTSRDEAAPGEFIIQKNGLDALVDALAQGRFTAVFCYNDQLAVQLLHALKRIGLHVPQYVSVLGFDDSVLAPATDPPLTSISHPKQALGREAAFALIDFINGVRADPYRRLFAPSLVERQSCRKCDSERQ